MKKRIEHHGAALPDGQLLMSFPRIGQVNVAQILTELGVQDMILLTNSHHTLVALDGYGLSIVGERPIPCSGDE